MAYFTHAMRDDVADIVGADAALVFSRLSHWIDADMQAGKYEEHEGVFYARVSVVDLATRFSWLSEDQVKRAVKKLREAGFIQVPVDADGKRVRLGKNRYHNVSWMALGPQKTPAPSKVQNRTYVSAEMHRHKCESALTYIDNTPSNTPSNAPARETGEIQDPPVKPQPDPDEPDAKAVWKRYQTQLLDILGSTKVSLTGDAPRFAKAVLDAPGWTAEQVAEAVVVQCRAERDAQSEERFRKALHTILLAGTWKAHLGSEPVAAPAYESPLDRMEREEREAEAAWRAAQGEAA